MTIKIKNVSIAGLRGARNKLEIPLNERCALIYGDNGAGKSTISDVFEWLYYNRVEHLSNEEIGKNGYEALRNIFLADNESGLLDLEYSKGNLNCQKSIKPKASNFVIANSNTSEDFENYIKASESENLILRYKDLTEFVLGTKTDKLTALSEIIGYSQVTNTKSALRGVLNKLSSEVKTKNFDNHISNYQSQIIEQFTHNVTSDMQFIDTVKVLTENLSLGIPINTLLDVNEVLSKIKRPDDSKEINQHTFLLKIQSNILDLPVNLDVLENAYSEYKFKFDSIVSDIQKLNKLLIEKVLTAGQELLSGATFTDNHCPLCLESKKKSDLLSSINLRITELEEIKKFKSNLLILKSSLKDQVDSVLQILRKVTDDLLIDDELNSSHKENLKNIESSVLIYQHQLNTEVAEGAKLSDEESLKIDRDLITTINQKCSKQIEAISKSRVDGSITDIYSKIKIASTAYSQIINLKKQKESFDRQIVSIKVIYEKFLKKQKEGLDAFLDQFSNKIDEIYQFLNPGEKVCNFKLSPIIKEDELTGITFKFDFYDNKDVSPPHKLLSESHLNCLGIAFFLASVEAFNKVNKFILLDDVVSSFDANHRKRFADLLLEKYTEYQIIILTHEKTWFDLVKNLAQKKNWLITTIKHGETEGVYFDSAPSTLRDRIQRKIKARDEENLAHDSRKYLENNLKSIASILEVKVPFLYNDKNEDRMAWELLTALQSTLNSRNCTELKSNLIISRLLNSLAIGNKDSHDSSTILNFSDMNAFWDDVVAFEKLFFCVDCKSSVTLKGYNQSSNQTVSCNCGELKYSWKK